MMREMDQDYIGQVKPHARKERRLNFFQRIYYRITRTRPSRTPNPGHTPSGGRAIGRPQDDTATQRALMRENDSADILARAGYRIEQKPVVPGRKEPDYRIEGRIFDNYAPSTSRARNIWDLIREEKVDRGQADRIILNLEDSHITLVDLSRQFNDWPMPGLLEVIVVRGGQVIPFWP
jgi:hypothetical protein